MNETRKWNFYNFDENWSEFVRVWKTDSVQKVLQKHMEKWCETEAYLEKDDETGENCPPIYDPKKPLWRYSKTDFWDFKITEETNDFMEKEKIMEKYREKVKNETGRELDFEGEDEDEFFRIFNKHTSQFEPKTDTLESFIMIMGKNCLSFPLFETAKKLFPKNSVVRVKDENKNVIILIPEEKIVFDIYDYFFCTRENYEMKTDEFYDKLYSKYLEKHRNK